EPVRDVLRTFDQLDRIGCPARCAPAVLGQHEQPAVLDPKVAWVVPEAADCQENRTLYLAVFPDDPEERTSLAHDGVRDLAENSAFLHLGTKAVLVEHGPAHIHEGV